MAHVASSSHRHVPRGFDLNDCGLAVAAHTNPKSRFIVGSHGVAHLPIAEDPEDLDGHVVAHLSQQCPRTGR